LQVEIRQAFKWQYDELIVSLIGQNKRGFFEKIINNFVESIKVMGDQGSPVKWALCFTTVNFTGQARFTV
jgi:hypothetical protein